MKIACFGECMVELSGQPLQRTFGGDTLNTALYLARLGRPRGIEVCYATALGVDTISQDMLTAWQKEQIDTRMVRQLPHKLPGLYLVETEPSGRRHYHYWRNDSAAKFYFADFQSPLEQAIERREIDVLYISGISLAILAEEAKAVLVTLVEKHHQQGGKVIFDNNFRPQLWTAKQAQYWYSQVLPFVDIALLTEQDELRIWGESDSMTRCQQLGCDEVVIKRGSAPCIVATGLQSAQPHITQVAAQHVETIIDSTASGDAFAAGYLAGRLAGSSETAAAELGHQLAALVLQHEGAIIPLDAMKEVLS